MSVQSLLIRCARSPIRGVSPSQQHELTPGSIINRDNLAACTGLFIVWLIWLRGWAALPGTVWKVSIGDGYFPCTPFTVALDGDKPFDLDCPRWAWRIIYVTAFPVLPNHPVALAYKIIFGGAADR
jgi:hypothetical protein